MEAITRDVDTILRAALQARQAGNAAAERAILTDALAQSPNSPHVWNAWGMFALAQAIHDEAAVAFERAIALDPGVPTLWINLATAQRGRGNDAGEAAALESVLAIDQRHFIAQLRMAESLERQGKLSQASMHWSAVVQLASGMPEQPPLVVDAANRGRLFLQEHNVAFEQALAGEFGFIDNDDPAMRRFNACVDTMLGKRRIYRNECAGIHFPFLPADEFFDRKYFTWFEAMEAKTPEIRAEALSLLNDGHEAIRPYVRQAAGTPENKWSALDNRMDWSACFLWEYGERNEPVCERCPTTAALLEAVPQSHVPGKAPNAFFSILRPGAHIPPHTGVTNTRSIIHLPLVVPDGCGFRVGGETRPWEEGRAFAFDDTIEHEAWNNSGKHRIVLIFDVWNPHLTIAEQGYLTKLFSVASRGITATRA